MVQWSKSIVIITSALNIWFNRTWTIPLWKHFHLDSKTLHSTESAVTRRGSKPSCVSTGDVRKTSYIFTLDLCARRLTAWNRFVQHSCYIYGSDPAKWPWSGSSWGFAKSSHHFQFRWWHLGNEVHGWLCRVALSPSVRFGRWVESLFVLSQCHRSQENRSGIPPTLRWWYWEKKKQAYLLSRVWWRISFSCQIRKLDIIDVPEWE